MDKSNNWTPEQYKEYMVGQRRKTKYLARKTKVDGITFDSTKEANFYCDLKIFLAQKLIKGFARQVQFVLVEGSDTERAVTYKADFVVFYEARAEIVDVKGFRKSKEWERTYKLFRLKFPELELELI